MLNHPPLSQPDDHTESGAQMPADPIYVEPAARVAVFDNEGTLGAMDFFDDGPEKPIRIWSRIGRRPILAFGNSSGDVPMLAYSGSESLPALRLLLLHDDPDREFDYTTGAEQALDIAGQQNWTVVSMKNDWNTVFTDAT
jgi:hypothetical protein